MTSVVASIRELGAEERRAQIVESYVRSYPDLIASDPDAWRGKFRKMAVTPFAFYRGSAALFYQDMAHEDDPFTNEQTGRVWIQGDLHADNFGTYMNSAGVLVFDVNDFDEAYVGPFTWDLKRMAASLALIGYQKALSDEHIRRMIEVVARGYAAQVAAFAEGRVEGDFALTIASTDGKLLEILRQARLKTRLDLLQDLTTIDDYDRRFTLDRSTRTLEAPAREEVKASFERYLDTIPERKRFEKVSYRIKDMVGRRGVGIGSAGLPSYNVLVEGRTQALENDIVIYMKESVAAAPSRATADPQVATYFATDAERTVVSQRALQAYADPWLGHTELGGTGYLVAEVSPYQADLDWDEVDDLDDILQVLGYLGKAVAKIHCVSDEDSDQTLVPFSTERAIHEVLAGHEEDFVRELVEFGEGYGAIARDDYVRFVDAFRNGMIADL